MISHLNKKNKPTIVDISTKKQTKRIAIAQGIIQFSKKTFKEKEKSLIDLLNDYNFDLRKTYSTWGLGLTSGLKATDNLFVHKSLLI